MVACLNSLAVGYQGVSARSSNHRQSDMKGNSTHNGLPNAPARLTMDVSLEITRSKEIFYVFIDAHFEFLLASYGFSQFRTRL
jgi:hypothetical protein